MIKVGVLFLWRQQLFPANSTNKLICKKTSINKQKACPYDWLLLPNWQSTLVAVVGGFSFLCGGNVYFSWSVTTYKILIKVSSSPGLFFYHGFSFLFKAKLLTICCVIVLLSKSKYAHFGSLSFVNLMWILRDLVM